MPLSRQLVKDALCRSSAPDHEFLAFTGSQDPNASVEPTGTRNSYM